MPVEPVRLGIVGVGRIVRNRFAPALARTHAATLQAAASRDRSRAEALEPRRAYSSYAALLEDPDVEAVYIATHNGLHRDLAVAAFAEGKHVLCEKPLGRSAAECEEMAVAARTAGCLLMEAFMYRHHPQIAEVARVVGSGAIGDLTRVEATFHIPPPDRSDVRMHRAWAGGSLFDVGCYCVHLARTFLGDDPHEVRAQATFDPECDIDMALEGELAYPSGTRASLACSFTGGFEQRALLIGTAGTLELREPFVTWERPPVLTVRTEHDERVTTFDPVDTFRLEIENFSAAIRGTAAPLLPAEDGLKNARIIDRLLAAARS